MKIVLLSLIVFTLYTGGSAQVVSPEQTAKDFYKWYLSELNAEREPIRDNKRLMLQKVSTRLGKWLYSTAYEEYGADYILDAQDYEQSWVNGISAAPAATRAPPRTACTP